MEEEAAAELEDPLLGWNEKLEDDVESCLGERNLGERKVRSAWTLKVEQNACYLLMVKQKMVEGAAW